jgi:hypothetical protein
VRVALQHICFHRSWQESLAAAVQRNRDLTEEIAVLRTENAALEADCSNSAPGQPHQRRRHPDHCYAPESETAS